MTTKQLEGRTAARRAASLSHLAPDAGAIASFLTLEAEALTGSTVHSVTRELVVPVTNERADIAVLGEALWLLEIKSGRDSLRRLPRQAEAFGRIADRCVLVSAARHLSAAAAILPAWWGIVEVIDGPTMSMRPLRAAGLNPSTDRKSLLLMLRRHEAARLLADIDGLDRSRRRRMSLLAELDRRLEDREIRDCVRHALIQRRRSAQ